MDASTGSAEGMTAPVPPHRYDGHNRIDDPEKLIPLITSVRWDDDQTFVRFKTRSGTVFDYDLPGIVDYIDGERGSGDRAVSGTDTAMDVFDKRVDDWLRLAYDDGKSTVRVVATAFKTFSDGTVICTVQKNRKVKLAIAFRDDPSAPNDVRTEYADQFRHMDGVGELYVPIGRRMDIDPAITLKEVVETAWRPEVFTDQDGQPHILFWDGDHYRVMEARDGRIVPMMSSLYFNNTSELVGPAAVQKVVNNMAGCAMKNPSRTMHLRMAKIDGSIWYDLSNDRRESVRINGDGWEIVENSPVLFRDFPKREQSRPERGESGQLDKYIETLRYDDTDIRRMMKVITVTAFNPAIENPILVLLGPSGSGKTIQNRMERDLIDPCPGDLSGLAKDSKDEIGTKLKMSKHYFVAFNNVNGFPSWFQDLANVATGGTSEEVRELYTTNDTRMINIKCLLRINGINQDMYQADSLRRSIIVERELIDPKQKVDEEKMFADFYARRPYLLAEIFDILSRALKRAETKDYLMPAGVETRLVSWYKFSCAVAEELDITEYDWCELFKRFVAHQDETVIDQSVIGQAILELEKEYVAEYGPTWKWWGTPSELLTKLNKIAAGDWTVEDGRPVKRSDGIGIDIREKSWPNKPNALSRRLNTIKGSLRAQGIFVITGKICDIEKDFPNTADAMHGDKGRFKMYASGDRVIYMTNDPAAESRQK